MTPRRLASAASAFVVLAVTSVAATDATVARPAVPAQDGRVEFDLQGQTPTVPPEGRFEVELDLAGTPPDGSVEVVVHGRVRSRSELARSMEGEGLRSAVYRVTTPVSELPAAEDGGRRVTVSLDASQPNGVAITAAGAYPVEIIGRDIDGGETGRLVTHMLVEPPSGDESPPLAVAVVASLGARPALRPDGRSVLAPSVIEDISGLLGSLEQAEVGATLVVNPETVDALRASDDEGADAAIESLRATGEVHSAAIVPYSPVSPDALVRAGLEDELARQLDAGRAVLTEALGEEPDQRVWLAGDDLGAEGAGLLARSGITGVVVDPDRVEPLRSGLLSLSLAQPFLVGEEDREIDAIALDAAVLDRIGTDETPAVEAHRLLAELAMLWFERPGVERAAVVPIDTRTRPEVVTLVLQGLERARILDAAPLDAALATADPLTQPGGNRVSRDLLPETTTRISNGVARDLAGVTAQQGSLTAMVGAGSERLEPMARHLRLATSSAVSVDDQRAHLDAARASVSEVVASVTAPARETITMTAREGTVPLTLVNETSDAISVNVRLSSAKLAFPDGDTIPITLQPGSTRIDIAVEVLASGAFPLQVDVVSPDGALALTQTAYSIRSTAVSGVGVVLSAGAALFLVVWWARHWSRTRRSSKLVEATADGSGESDVPARP